MAHPLALTSVNAGSDLEAGLAEAIADGDGASYGSGRPVEGGEESVAGGADLLPAEMFELATHRRVMLFEEVAPGFIAQRCRPCSRPDDVGEQDGGEDAIGLGSWPNAREECLDLVDPLGLVSAPGEVIRSGKLEELCIWDTSRDVSPLFDVRVAVAGAVQDQRRDANRGKAIAAVDLW